MDAYEQARTTLNNQLDNFGLEGITAINSLVRRYQHGEVDISADGQILAAPNDPHESEAMNIDDATVTEGGDYSVAATPTVSTSSCMYHNSSDRGTVI